MQAYTSRDWRAQKTSVQRMMAKSSTYRNAVRIEAAFRVRAELNKATAKMCQDLAKQVDKNG